MSFQRAHGLTIAQNGFIENMVCESVSSDPTVVTAGRLWFNQTEKLFKFSTLNAGGAVVIKAIKDKEDYDALVATLVSQAANNSGSHFVGYDGQAGTNEKFSVTAGTIAAALDAIISRVDTNVKDIEDITGGSGVSLSELQTEVNAIETGVGLGTDGTYVQPTTSNYLNSSTSVAGAIGTLDSRAKTNADAIATEANARASADNLKVDLAGDTMSGSLDFAGLYRVTGLAEPTDPQDAATKNYVDAFSAGLDPKASALCTTTGNITLSGLQTIDGITVVAGNRVLVKNQTNNVDNGIYVADSDAWVRATDFDGTPSNEVSGGAFCFVEEGTLYANMGFVVQAAGNVVVDTDPIIWVQFSGAGQIIAGAGIAKTGNEIFLKFGAGIMELPNDEIGIDLYANGGLFLTEDGSAASETSEAEIGIKLDGTTLSLSASGLRLSDTTNSTLSGLQSELDNTQTGAGLGTGGSYTADGSADYISAATSLKNADSLLDDQLKTVTDGLASEVTARGNADSALQTELDNTQLGAGLNADGSWTPPASNYLSGSTSIKLGVSQLDTAVKSNQTAISNEVDARALAVSNEATARGNADSALQTEIDNIETAMGTVIGNAGTYVAFSTTNYINANTNVSADLVDLDTAIKAVSDALDSAVGGGSGTTLTSLQTEIDNVETSTGGMITATGTYAGLTGTNYLNGNVSLAAEFVDIDAQVKINADNIAANVTSISNLQTELDNTQAGAGLTALGAYTVDAASNYLKAANFGAAGYTASINSAVRLLDAALKAEETARTSGGSALQTEVDALETSLGGMVNSSGVYVPFTGKNYINGNETITADLVDLDNAIKMVEIQLIDEIGATSDHFDLFATQVNTAINNLTFTFTSTTAATEHVVEHALNDQMVDVSVWVKDTDLKYRNDLVGVTITDANTITVNLTESRDIKVIVRSTASLALVGTPEDN